MILRKVRPFRCRGLAVANILIFAVVGCADSSSSGVSPDGAMDEADRGEVRLVLDAELADGMGAESDSAGLERDGALPDMCPNPEEESCNGLDDDCDGRVDEDFGVGDECTAGVGQCQNTGEIVCISESEAACNVEPGNGSTEYCNALDDDCDGRADESYANLGFACEVTEGECSSSGRVVCAEGGLSTECDAQPVVVTEELCDGADNDCDGQTDEGLNVGELCESGVGLCRRGGFNECGEEGGVVCTAVPGPPADEACDGFDNDCDGVPDEDFGGGVCTAGVGGCVREGFLACNADGDLVCNAVAGEPGFESCNDVDDDCDGEVDERWPDLGGPCTAGEGICARDGVVACTDVEGGGLEFEGVQQNLAIADLEAGGFELCWSGDFGGTANIDEVLERCNQDVLLMGCRPNAQVDSLTIAAMGERAEVLTDVGPGANATHQHNGVGWYFHRARSWGFAPGGLPVSRNSCDTNAMEPDLRMCWHTSNGRITSGYRCGNPRNGVRQTLRVIYHRSAGPTAECTAVAGEPAEAEVCNGNDDDCDGATDEEIEGVGESCELDGLELCQIAETQCTDGGEVECLPKDVEPAQESCNERDDDCDGSVDEDFPELGDACSEGVGACLNEGVYVCSGDEERAGGLAFEGVRQNVPAAEIAAGGFEPCWTGRFGGQAAIADILEACGEPEWIMGCRPVGQAALNVAATGRRDEILTDVGPGQAATHEHNGVSWYYNGSRSWGFAAEGTGVSRNSCDTRAVEPDSRMCWHTSNNRVTSGYRCGRTTLNGNNNWERIIYHRPEGGRSVCSAGPGEPAENEVCNTIDDDCDGETDEGVEGAGEWCELEGLAACHRGQTSCNEEGVLMCMDVEVEPEDESCNNYDDDCDGAVDEAFPELGEACAVGEGVCRREGVMVCGGGPDHPVGLAFEGIRQNVPLAELEASGFELCWSGVYNGREPMANILAGCDQGELLLGCRPNNSDALTLAATGERAEVLTDLGREALAVHNHNGVDWYFSDNYSMGFLAEGTGVRRNSCDTGNVQAGLRMCWHSSGGSITSGYRCGNTILNGNGQWTRAIYHRAPGALSVCSAAPGEPLGDEACNGQDDDCDGVVDEDLDCLPAGGADAGVLPDAAVPDGATDAGVDAGADSALDAEADLAMDAP